MRPNQLLCAGLALLLCCIRSPAADLDFYHCFLSLVDTNDLRVEGATNALLVDVNNTEPKLTNSVISLQKLRTDGVVGSIRLGMTMQEVVARWGKPIWLNPRCDGGHRFVFTDCSLVLQGNSLCKLRFGETGVFDNSLSARSSLKDWVQALGQPTLRNDNVNGSSLVYETRGRVRTVLLLIFHPTGDLVFPPTLYLDAPLTNWSKAPRP